MDAEIERSPELEAVIRRWMRAIERKDARALTALLTSDAAMRYVGTDADEVFGGELFRRGFGRHIGEVASFESEEETVEAFSAGSVGWGLWLGRLSFSGREPVKLRYTTVFVLEAGIWRVAQAHVSTPRSNVEVMGLEHSVFRELMAAAEEGGARFGDEGTATIMFTDVANSTSIAAFVGDRAWSSRIGVHLDGVRRIVEEAGGALVKSLGDGTMSSFASARAAMAAADRVRRTAEAAEGDPPLRVRIGLHSGDVVRTGDDFFGTVVNTAARIAAIAEPGTVLVSDAARALAGEAPGLAFDAPRAVELRGVAGETRVSRLVSAG